VQDKKQTPKPKNKQNKQNRQNTKKQTTETRHKKTSTVGGQLISSWTIGRCKSSSVTIDEVR
jgi:hypothetical protein